MRDTRASGRTAARLGGILALAALSAGCATTTASVRRMGEAPAPREATMSAEVRAAARRPTTYPRFTDIPPTPDDVRSMAGWDRAVTGARRSGVQLKAEIAAAPPPPTDTAAFAAQGAAEATPPPSPDAAPNTEAFAAKARAAVKPPPTPK